jgi:hypothetical protein
VNPTPTAKTIYTPPRPNLGPDPLVESPSWLGVALAFAFVVSTFLVWRVRRRKPIPATSKPRPSVPDESSDSPRDHMIAWSLSLRESMAGTFGPTWLAKTTEEIARDSTLFDTIGPEPAAQLLAFLADADRTKFADTFDLPPSTLADSELRDLMNIIAKAVPKSNPPPS